MKKWANKVFNIAWQATLGPTLLRSSGQLTQRYPLEK